MYLKLGYGVLTLGFVIFCDLENGIHQNKQTQKMNATFLYQLLITSNFGFLSKKISALQRS